MNLYCSDGRLPLDLDNAGISDVIAHLVLEEPSLLVFGGMNPMVGSGFTSEAASQVLQFFPGHLDNWWGVSRLPEPRVHFAAVQYKGHVYIIGDYILLINESDSSEFFFFFSPNLCS
jgi:hypothetical protein